MSDATALYEYTLRMGDNCLVMAQRLSELLSSGPALEEDLAIGNVSLDLIGQTRMWLGLAGEIEGKGRDADKLAFTRDACDFRNVLLVEMPNGDFANTMARQFFFDVWHFLTLQALVKSSDPRVAEIADKCIREVAYHVDRSREWVLRLGDGTEESHRRMQTAIDDLWMYTGEMFEADAVETGLAAQGVGVVPASIHGPWMEQIKSVLEEATLTVPKSGWMQRGGKHGVHSENLGFLLADLQFLQRAYPNATW